MPSALRKLRNKVQALRAMTRGGDKAVGLGTIVADLVRKRWHALRLATEVRHLHGPRRPPVGRSEVVAVCSLRDGAEHIDHFLRHHRRLGVRHFVFLDNGSRDGSVERLSRERDVTVFSSRLPFRDYKHHFKRFLVRRAGRDRWCLVVDIDECFDFPGSNTLGLDGFCRYLDARGFNAVVAHMLDLFHRGPLLQPPPVPEGDLPRVHRFYDLTGIKADDHVFVFGASNTISNPAIKCLSCGITMLEFGNDAPLTKHPLFRWSSPLEMPKYFHDIGYARIADVSAVLYHFKYTAGFSRTLERALRERSYFDASARYARIAERLRREPELSLCRETTRELQSINDLVDAGFLVTSPAFEQWLDEKATERRGVTRS